MRNTSMLAERQPDGIDARPGTTTRPGTTPGSDTTPGPGTDSARATVFPAPLTTVVAALIGGVLGIAAVYGVASRLAGSLAAVAAIVMVFAVTLAGPRVHAAARTERGRTLAVVLQAIGFGGVVGALIVLT